MKNTIRTILVLLLISAQQLHAQNRSIQFAFGSWDEVKLKAQKESKIIFVDAFTTWCGPCKWLAKNVFTNDTVADFYNSNFINVSIDMEKGQGIELAKQWAVKAYPTLLFIASNGEVLHRACGSMEVAKFVQLGKDALNTETQFATAQKKYESGKADIKFLAAYVLQLQDNCMAFQKERDAYFSTQKEADLLSNQNWEIIRRTLKDIDSREFKYVESHQADFSKLYDAKMVNETIDVIYESALIAPIRKDSLDNFNSLRAKVLQRNTLAAKKAVANADMAYFKKKKDWDNYIKSTERYIADFEPQNWNLLNSTAWTLFENISDKKQLESALNLAKKSVLLNENGANIDTYANLLFKSGDKKSAVEYEKKAIELAKKDGDEGLAKELEETLKKFETK